MRRSTTITLTLLAGAGLGLAYCNGGGEPDTEGVLETQAACVGRLGAEAVSECEDVFQSARATHAATAPRFDSADACRAATGTDCTPLSGEPRPAGAPWASASGVFIPVMAGVMIGRLLADGTRGATPVYAGGLPPGCLPGTPGPNCPPPTSSSTSSSSSSSSSSGSSRRYWYSGGSYAGSSDGAGRAGFRPATASSQGEGLLSRNARTSSGVGRSASGSRSGGLGFSAAAHSGGGS